MVERTLEQETESLAIRDRLLWYITTLYGGDMKRFSEVSGVPRTTLQRYTTEKVDELRLPTAEAMSKFSRLGFNIHWLITGEGLWYAPNPTGDTLRARYGQLLPEGGNYQIVDAPSQRLEVMDSEELALYLLEKLRKERNLTSKS